MSTLVFVDPEISTQADRAQSSQVPVSLLNDPYEAISQAYLVETDAESEPFEDLETETPELSHTVASHTSLHDSTPPICHFKESEGSDTSGARSTSSDFTAPFSPYHPLTHTTLALVPSLRRTYVWPGLGPLMIVYHHHHHQTFLYGSVLRVHQKDEGLAARDESPTTGDEGLALGEEGLGMRVESLGLGGDAGVPEAPSIVFLPISSPMILLIVPSSVALLVMAKVEEFLTELGAQVEMQGGLILDHHTMENRELRLQITEERRAQLDLAEIIDSIMRGREPKVDVYDI
nr:hypothetical protein [Tanacetum cinerariifolium]